MALIAHPIVNAKIDQASDDLDTTNTKYTFISANSGTLLLWRPAGESGNFPTGWFLNGNYDDTQVKTRKSDGKPYLKLCDGYQVSNNPN
jgi:hypothetical protein